MKHGVIRKHEENIEVKSNQMFAGMRKMEFYSKKFSASKMCIC